MTTTLSPTRVHTVGVVVSSSPPAPARPLHLRLRRLADGCVIALFAAAILVVWAGTFVREQPPLDENRLRHPPPPLAPEKHVVQDYPKWFEMYFNDRVGYRDVLLGWHHRLMYHAFDDPVSKLAWVGRDGWLYLNVADPTAGRDGHPTVGDRLRAWADALADRHAYLKARGIGYVVLVPPEKSSVFPEHLRGYVARHPPPEPAEAFGHLLAERGVRFVNPLPPLLAAKATCPHPLYYKLDSHWTYDGGRIGYRLLAAEIGRTHPGFVPHPDDGFAVSEQPLEGDLGRLVGIPGAERLEPARRFTPTGRSSRQDDKPAFANLLPPAARPPHLPPRRYECDAATGPPLVLFRDSFGEQLMPFVRVDFRRSAVVASYGLELPVIDAVTPAVVVQEIVARKLYSEPPVNPPEVAGYSKR